MSHRSTFVFGTIFAAAFVTAAPALAMAPLSGLPGATPFAAPLVIPVEKKKPIDPSCLMVCVKWVGDNCEKFEMKCKGDPGYPSASTVKPGKATADTLKDPGKAGNAGNEGKSMMQKGTGSKSVQP